jgi:hypothetical protein
MFGTVELLSDELSIPSQDGVWPGNTGDLPKRPASQTFSDLGQRSALRIGEPESAGQFGAKDAVLRRQVLVP